LRARPLFAVDSRFICRHAGKPLPCPAAVGAGHPVWLRVITGYVQASW
jgi:hypothetical protein